MTIYTLCVAIHPDDWPELGDWEQFVDLTKLLTYAEKEYDLDIATWVDIDGESPSVGDATGPGTLYNCLLLKSNPGGIAPARVHVNEVEVH